MTRAAARTGRPLRALAGLALLLALWVAARLPMLVAEMAAILAPRPPPLAPILAARAKLVLAASRDPRGVPDLPRARAAVSSARSRLQLLPAPGVLPATPVGASALLASVDAPDPVSSAPPVAANDARALPPAPESDPGALAATAYARLAAGDRRDAARLFDAALAAGTDPRAADWQRARRRLASRWSGDAYALIRAAGATGPTAAPVLGGGQAGATLGFTLNPLARRPMTLVARGYSAIGDPATAQGALGVRWQLAPGVSLAAEQLFGLGAAARSDSTLRLAMGRELRRGRALASGYGEVSLLGSGDVLAGGQMRAGLALPRGKVLLIAGGGGWASYQAGDQALGRVDIGPTLAARLPIGAVTIEASADWRFRVVGRAEPGSGPALTIGTRF